MNRTSKTFTTEADAKADSGAAAMMGHSEHEGPHPGKQSSLVIEDYYCVSVEPSDVQVAPASLLADALEGDSLQGANTVDILPPGQDSSFISEGEGPAQWLAAPRAGPDHVDNLSMESAEDTSESEGEIRCTASSLSCKLVPDNMVVKGLLCRCRMNKLDMLPPR